MRPKSNFRIDGCDLGRGLFAVSPIRANDKILRFEGPAITFQDTLNMQQNEGNTFQIGPTRYVDTQPPGLFFNHSCDPNAGVVNTRTLIALVDIITGNQICFDYSTTMDEDHWTMECRCGSAVCRGTIRDFKYLPEALRTYYIRLGIVPEFVQRALKSKVESENGRLKPVSSRELETNLNKSSEHDP